MKKVALYISGGLIIILLVLMYFNPSLNTFKEYDASIDPIEEKTVYRRVSNFLIFSIFEKKVYEVHDDGWSRYKYSYKYTGFLGNFWERN